MNKAEALAFLTEVYHEIVVGMNVEKIHHYFSDDYIQMTDGIQSDIHEFKHHIGALKDALASISISPFYDFLYDEPLQTATLRYLVGIQKKDGTKGQIELIAIFELDGRKVIRCNELSRPIDSDPAFKEIASLN